MPFDSLTPSTPEHDPVLQPDAVGTSGAKPVKTQYVLAGFSQTAAIRLYSFEGIGEGRRVGHTVEVDLSLIQKHGIRIQDLPLLCRELLQKRESGEAGEAGALTFTEHEMREHAEKLAVAREESARKRHGGRRPVNTNPGSGWNPPLR